jgi:hypothetical protein
VRGEEWLPAGIRLPAAVALLLAAPMLLIGFFADRVANLPVQALVAGLIAGLIAPAFVAASRHLVTCDRSPRRHLFGLARHIDPQDRRRSEGRGCAGSTSLTAG